MKRSSVSSTLRSSTSLFSLPLAFQQARSCICIKRTPTSRSNNDVLLYLSLAKNVLFQNWLTRWHFFHVLSASNMSCISSDGADPQLCAEGASKPPFFTVAAELVARRELSSKTSRTARKTLYTLLRKHAGKHKKARRRWWLQQQSHRWS